MPDMSKKENHVPIERKGTLIIDEPTPAPTKSKPVKAHDLPPMQVAPAIRSTNMNHWTVRGRVISASFAWPTAIFCAGAMVRWLLGVFLNTESMGVMTEISAGTFQTILFGMGVILGPIFATVGFGIRNKK